MKQVLAAMLRSLGLIAAMDRLRFASTYFRNLQRNKAFQNRNPGLALPPPYAIYETFRIDYERYVNAGKADAAWIRDILERHLTLQNKDVLDWGCGPGRVVRHLPEVIGNGCRFYGTDYNPSYVRWCAEHLPGIDFRKNKLEPPLPFPAGAVDAIYAISIFTHLSEARHHSWFSDLMRVLRPGGVLLLTTHGDATRERLIPAEQVLYDEDKLVVRGHVKEGHRMYAAYQPPAFMRQLAAAHGADVLEHQDGEPKNWGISQDVWVFRKMVR